MATGNSGKTTVVSALSDQRGNHPRLDVRVYDNGLSPAVYFDLDRTLLRLDFIYRPALERLFPDVSATDELWRLHSDGFKLGTSYREFDRMHGIIREGIEGWEDPDRYLDERRAIIDADSPARRRSAEYTRRYADYAIEIARQWFGRNPAAFSQAHIKPVVQLLRVLRRIGIATACMTANNETFARDVLAYSGLAPLFLELAGDESMDGGGKEVAIQKLTDRMAKLGVSVAKHRLGLIGDSLLGDIGVARKLPGPYKAGGLLVVENEEALFAERQILAQNRDRRDAAERLGVRVFVLDRVPCNSRGTPILGRYGSIEALSVG